MPSMACRAMDSYSAGKKALVAMHEFGHGLGLEHATSNESVMYSCPACAYNNGTRTLTADDISGVNSRY